MKSDETERADVVNKLKEAHSDLKGLENALSNNTRDAIASG